jgi:uncharacterized protein YjbJ (UPF0337 family)
MSEIVADYAVPVSSITRKEKHMSMRNKISNMLQDLRGRGKEALGSKVGNKDLESEGKADQGKAGLKDAGEKVKDAASNVKDAASNVKEALSGT